MAVITGNDLSNTLTGTSGSDIINGLGGNDTLIGLAGNDFYDFSGGFGNDTVNEAVGAGNDTLRILSGIPASAVRLVGNSADDLNVIVDGFGSIRLIDHLLATKVESLQIGSAAPISLTGGLTMTGSALSESIYGTTFNDTINGQAGNDTLNGATGNDFYNFSGGFGNDTVNEAVGAGNDTLRILSGIPASAVRLVGDSGADLNVIVDGFGSIRLADHLLATKVEFLQIGSAAPISLTGGLTMTGSALSESIYGTTFNDTINGKAGNDTLNGATGNDFYNFSGGFGNDTVNEAVGAGNDTLRILSDIPASAVRLVGDSGADLNVIVDGFGSIRLADHLLATKVEFLQIGSAAPISLTGGLTMTGSALSESIYGTTFNDTINGQAGNDTLNGATGNDFYNFSGGFGNDTVNEAGGAGTDTLRILSGIPASAVRLVGNSADDLNVIVDGFGSIRLIDHLLATKVESLQIGSAAPISLTGGLTMTGSALSESIYGTTFNDTINGKAGNDTFTGGAGQDRFVFEGNFGSDRVSDFSKTQLDRLDFSQIDANSGIAGDQSFSFIGTSAFTTAGGQINYVASGGNTVVQLNTDSDTAAEFQVQLVGTIALTATDILG